MLANQLSQIGARRAIQSIPRLYGARWTLHVGTTAASNGVVLGPKHVVLPPGRIDPSKPLHIPYIWLRDSCPCPTCVDPNTSQKNHRSSDIPLDSRPLRAVWKADDVTGNETLEVEWEKPIYRHDTLSQGLEGHSNSDAKGHLSRYPASFLGRHCLPTNLDAFNHTPALQPIPWLTADLVKQPHTFIAYDDFRNNKETLLDALTQLVRYGIVILRGVPTTPSSDGKNDWEVRKVANEISQVRATMYGDLWDVKSYPKSINIAYTDVDLDLHMDMLCVISVGLPRTPLSCM